MMDSKILLEGTTPGPWEAEQKLDPADLAAPWVGRLSENQYAALSCGKDVEERLANARLIAAAPRLALEHERLVEMVEHFIDIIDGTEQTGFDPSVEQMLMDAADEYRAALKGCDALGGGL